jgi:hypothetical protein
VRVCLCLSVYDYQCLCVSVCMTVSVSVCMAVSVSASVCMLIRGSKLVSNSLLRNSNVLIMSV